MKTGKPVKGVLSKSVERRIKASIVERSGIPAENLVVASVPSAIEQYKAGTIHWSRLTKAEKAQVAQEAAEHSLPVAVVHMDPPAATKADYRVSGGGTVYLIEPLNPGAKQNLLDNTDDEAQWLGEALAVEHRYIEGLVETLREEGWVVE